MAKGVFTTKAESGYDDDRTSRYHFPKQYLEKVRQTVGDFVVYYEPRRNGGRQSYIAVVRVLDVVPDERLANHHYALVRDYLDFDRPVPFRSASGLFERGLESTGKTGLSGDFRNAVRLIDDDEFGAILAAGFSETLISEALERQSSSRTPFGVAEEPLEFDSDRPLISRLTSRPFRDDAFSRHVKQEYNGTCAFTGLSMRNGGGRTEVDAAHIKPVGGNHRGPDSIRNGIALSKTVHWMFDRGLLAVDQDYRILTAKSLVPVPILRLLNPSGSMNLPENERARPHSLFLEYHRNHIFKDAQD